MPMTDLEQTAALLRVDSEVPSAVCEFRNSGDTILN